VTGGGSVGGAAIRRPISGQSCIDQPAVGESAIDESTIAATCSTANRHTPIDKPAAICHATTGQTAVEKATVRVSDGARSALACEGRGSQRHPKHKPGDASSSNYPDQTVDQGG
jgi:hypothetical protein